MPTLAEKSFLPIHSSFLGWVLSIFQQKKYRPNLYKLGIKTAYSHADTLKNSKTTRSNVSSITGKSY